MTVDVDLAALADIRTRLTQAGSDLDGIDTSATVGVDAGLMTPIIATMMSEIIESAANLSDGLTGTGAVVGMCREYYQRADADAQASMDQITRAMEEGE